jgi:hypothetical protein
LKKEPKNFWALGYVARRAHTPKNKSHSLLFFRKEDLPYFPTPCISRKKSLSGDSTIRAWFGPNASL